MLITDAKIRTGIRDGRHAGTYANVLAFAFAGDSLIYSLGSKFLTNGCGASWRKSSSGDLNSIPTLVAKSLWIFLARQIHMNYIKAT